MAAIKSLEAIARKWATVTPMRSDDYRQGVESPRRDWAQAATAAKGSWADGVTKAIQRDGFAKGVSAAGSEAWRQGTQTKGVQRWGPGVQLAETTYGDGFAAAHRAIAAVTLPPRFARRDPRNLERVRAIVDALSKIRST